MSLREWRNRDSATPIGSAIPRRVGRVASPEEIAEQERRVAAQAEAQRRKREASLWQAAGVPLRHAQRADFTGDAWLAKLDSLDARRGRGFLAALTGPRGVGKTQMAVELIRRSCRDEEAALFTSAMGFFYELRATYKRDASATEANVLKRFTEPALLVIDELQERGETEWEDRTLAHLLDQRYGAMRDTLLLTNLTAEELEKNLHRSVASRMRETGAVIVCNWPSYREAAR